MKQLRWSSASDANDASDASDASDEALMTLLFVAVLMNSCIKIGLNV